MAGLAAPPPPSGTFDWLLSLRAHPQLREFLLPSAHGLGPDARVLVVGSGDSTLSEDLWECGFPNVVGVDIEERCVAAARERTAGKAGLEWCALDLTESAGLPAALGCFALALDKGTLDAIVCVGDEATCRACWNVRAALGAGGVFVVVTFHRDGKIQRFLDAPALGFERVAAHALAVPPVFDGKVLVCRLPAASAAAARPASSFAEYRAQVMATAYEDATQLLTPEREAALRMLFAMRTHALGGDESRAAGVGLREAYALVFSDAERDEYAMEDFTEDAEAFDPALVAEGARWTADDAVRFLRAMQ